MNSLEKPIEFTSHALTRMSSLERGPISRDEVIQVVRNPDASYTGIDGKLNALGNAGNKQLRVCYTEEEDRILVITVINRGVSS